MVQDLQLVGRINFAPYFAEKSEYLKILFFVEIYVRILLIKHVLGELLQCVVGDMVFD